MWQKCPVCNGTGTIPGGHVSSSLFTTCPTCDGKRIISQLTGLPPSFANKEQSIEPCTTESNPESNKVENKPTLGVWFPWAVCEVINATGSVFQFGEDAVLFFDNSWVGETNGIHAKIVYQGSIQTYPGFKPTKTMRYK